MCPHQDTHASVEGGPITSPRRQYPTGTTARRRAQQERATERAERAEEAPPPELDEEEEGALAVTDADRAFIDDTGVEEEARVDFGEEDEVRAGRVRR